MSRQNSFFGKLNSYFFNHILLPQNYVFLEFDLKKDKEPDISMDDAEDQAKNMEKICSWFASR